MTEIVITDKGGGFAVAPDPAIPARPDLQGFFAEHRTAMRFADSLRIVKGWKVVDASTGGGGDG
jgi:hypothetical protein